MSWVEFGPPRPIKEIILTAIDLVVVLSVVVLGTSVDKAAIHFFQDGGP